MKSRQINQCSLDARRFFGRTDVMNAVVLLLIFSFLFLFSSFAHAARFEKTEKYAAFVMDASTGMILHQENANKRLHPASLTKMMTLLMAFDAIDNGALKLNDRVRISRHAADMVPSKLGLAPGQYIRVEDAIYALVTKSANDVAVALAEKLGTSEGNFALMMTKKARTLGMSRTRFKNASGLHDPAQVSTASDMARLARALMTTYGSHYHYFATKSFTYDGRTYRSHNRLMDTYEGMDGLKTGYIAASGFNLAASAKRGDRRIIGVVFGGKTAKSRNAQMAKLLDIGFSKIGSIEIAAIDAPIPQKKPQYKNLEIASVTPDINSENYKSLLTKQAIEQTQAPEREVMTIAHAGNTNQSHWDILNKIQESQATNGLLGEGDLDDNALRNRVETGLIAISAMYGEEIPTHLSQPKEQHYSNGNWSIQVGAYASRESTNRALAQNINLLPSELRIGRGSISPRKTPQGWIYRARIEGYSKDAANAACRHLPDCITLAPAAN